MFSNTTQPPIQSKRPRGAAVRSARGSLRRSLYPSPECKVLQKSKKHKNVARPCSSLRLGDIRTYALHQVEIELGSEGTPRCPCAVVARHICSCHMLCRHENNVKHQITIGSTTTSVDPFQLQQQQQTKQPQPIEHFNISMSPFAALRIGQCDR